MKNLAYTCYAVCLLLLAKEMTAQPPGYSYVKEIIIQENRIPDGPDLNDFPILFTTTDTSLRSVANGGRVENSNGYDIIFYLNSCNTQLDHQLEEYDPVTGKLTVWVRIPVLSTTSNTSIYLYYSNNTVTASTSSTAVWNATYSGVWHMAENPGGAAPQITDGTANNHHGTANGGMTAANLVAGKMGRALSFDEINDYIRIPDFLYGQELTVSFWFNATEVNGTSYQYLFSHGQWATQNSMNVYIGEHNITTPGETHNLQMLKTVFRDSNDANNFDTLNAGNTWIDGNWHFYTMRIQDFGGATIYVDGIQRANYAVWGANTFNPPTDIYIGGREDLHPNRFYGGLLDEVRISTVWRTSNWILTEFNNQNDPSTFFAAGFDGHTFSLCTPLPLKVTAFDAFRSGNYVKLQWRTDEQADNTPAFFIERSENRYDWHCIGSVSGSNNFTDTLPYKGSSYYRLKYFEGQTTYTSFIRKVEGDCCNDDIKIYPNPSADGVLHIEMPGKDTPDRVFLMNASGHYIQQLRVEKGDNGTYTIRTGRLTTKGLYMLKLEYGNSSKTKKIIIQ